RFHQYGEQATAPTHPASGTLHKAGQDVWHYRQDVANANPPEAPVPPPHARFQTDHHQRRDRDPRPSDSLENKAGVGAAKAEGIGHGDANGTFLRLLRHEIEVTARI